MLDGVTCSFPDGSSPKAFAADLAGAIAAAARIDFTLPHRSAADMPGVPAGFAARFPFRTPEDEAAELSRWQALPLDARVADREGTWDLLGVLWRLTPGERAWDLVDVRDAGDGRTRLVFETQEDIACFGAIPAMLSAYACHAVVIDRLRPICGGSPLTGR
jgi:hypothetical protein